MRNTEQGVVCLYVQKQALFRSEWLLPCICFSETLAINRLGPISRSRWPACQRVTSAIQVVSILLSGSFTEQTVRVLTADPVGKRSVTAVSFGYNSVQCLCIMVPLFSHLQKNRSHRKTTISIEYHPLTNITLVDTSPYTVKCVHIKS